MSRSLKKGPFVDEKLLKKLAKIKQGSQEITNTWKRNSTISPEMVGFRLGVHNGRAHLPVLVVEDMVGHKLGEFAPTRKFIKHGGRLSREEDQKAGKTPMSGKTASASETAKKPEKAKNGTKK